MDVTMVGFENQLRKLRTFIRIRALQKSTGGRVRPISEVKNMMSRGLFGGDDDIVIVSQLYRHIACHAIALGLDP